MNDLFQMSPAGRLKCDSVSLSVNQQQADIRQPIKDSIRRSAYWIPVAICPIEIPLQRERGEGRDKEQRIETNTLGKREDRQRGRD